MRPKAKKRGKRGAAATSHNRKGSVCELCAHDDDTPCGATCVKGLENPLVTNTFSFERRSPHLTAFYCQCAQLYGEIHRMNQLPAAEVFQEHIVVELGDKVLARFTQLLDDSMPGSKDGEDDEMANLPPLCPFVMMLSILMPSLRKFIAWIVKTRPAWASADIASSSGGNSASASNSSIMSSSQSQLSNNPFLAMVALHDVIMKLTLECEKLSRLIEMNEGAEEEQVYVRPKPAISGASSAKSANSVVATTPGELRPSPFPPRIPQVKKISLEFEEIYAEYKCELAELTESILEATETAEFMELLVLQLLDPIRKRAIESPSVSRPYLLPRILERCISVAMDEFVLDNVKMNEILAAQIEKGVTLLRAWSLKFEMEYNNFQRKRVSSIMHRSSESHIVALRAAEDAAAQAEASSLSARSTSRNLRPDYIVEDMHAVRLQLVGVDGFKRLDSVLSAWLCNSTKQNEEVMSARSRMKANLGGLRSTIARSISTKGH